MMTSGLITVEINESLARTARDLFAADPRVEVVTGNALRVGGRIVMDDLTQGQHRANRPA